MNIKELRRKKNISQQELSNKTGIPKARIGQWELGKGKPKVEDFKKLKSFFGLVDEESSQSVQRNEEDERGTSDNRSFQAVISLSESNRILSEANKKLADAHYVLAKNNEDLIRMLKPTVPHLEDTVRAFATKLAAVQDVLTEVLSSGKQVTVDDVNEAVRIKEREIQNVVKHADIHED